MIRFDRYKGGKRYALTFSYDDGVAADMRLVEILQKNGLRGTFNVNAGLFAEKEGEFRLTAEQVRDLYLPAGMELACHGYTHPHLERLPQAYAAGEILEDRRALEALVGVPVSGFAYPYGTYNDAVVAMLQMAGMHYARPVVSTESFEMPGDWLRLPATCHHANPRLAELGQRFLSLGKGVDPMRQTLQMFYVWGHSYEFDNAKNWSVIEDFAAMMAGQEDIWYATNREICGYMEAVSRLETGPDGRICYNPSAQDVCFLAGGKAYTVHGGETLVLD